LGSNGIASPDWAGHEKGLPVGEPWLRRLFGCWWGGLASSMVVQASRGVAWRVTHRWSLSIRESVGDAPRGAEAAAALVLALTHPTDQGARKKPGAVSRPGTVRFKRSFINLEKLAMKPPWGAEQVGHCNPGSVTSAPARRQAHWRPALC
jgi:hypothetical protein